MAGKQPLTITPSQTVGPFYAYCLSPDDYAYRNLATGAVATKDAVGERITVTGRVYDGEGKPVPDALVEIWQPDGEGRFPGHHPALKNSEFKGFGRVGCNEEGAFAFQTVKPGRVPLANGTLQAPHIAVSIFGKGLNRNLYTRVYFDDEKSNADDPILSIVPAELRPNLIATSKGSNTYDLGIRLQGDAESVFFEL